MESAFCSSFYFRQFFCGLFRLISCYGFISATGQHINLHSSDRERFMNLVAKMGIGVAAFTALIVADYYIGNMIAYQADVKACKTLTRAEVVDAVVADMTRPDKRSVNRRHFSPSDIVVETEAIQIGPSDVLAPFRIASEPERQQFAMLPCSALESIEYASE